MSLMSCVSLFESSLPHTHRSNLSICASFVCQFGPEFFCADSSASEMVSARSYARTEARGVRGEVPERNMGLMSTNSHFEGPCAWSIHDLAYQFKRHIEVKEYAC